MRLIIPILLNCILVFAVYMADKFTPAKKLPYITKQIIIGVLFGCVSAFASVLASAATFRLMQQRIATAATLTIVFIPILNLLMLIVLIFVHKVNKILS